MCSYEGMDLNIGNGVHYELNIDIDLSKTTSNEFSIELRKSKEKETKITFDLKNKKMIFNRDNSDEYSKGIRICDLDVKGNVLSFKILSDTSSIEIYTNDYTTVLTSNIYPSSEETNIKMTSKDKDVYVSRFEGYALEEVL